MFYNYKKHIFITILISLLIGSYWFFFTSYWGISIPNEYSWQYSFQDKNDLTFEKNDWFSDATPKEITKDKHNQNLLFRAEFIIDNPSQITEAILEYNYKYSVKIYINNIECADVNRNLIINSEDKNGIKIKEYWKSRQVKINRKTLRKSLKKGKNTIVLAIYNIEDQSKIDRNKKQLSFLTKGYQNNFNTKVKTENHLNYFTESSLPIFKINTVEKVIEDEPKINASLKIIDTEKGNNHWLDSSVNYSIKIERRGHTSQSFAKKSYSFNIRDGNGNAVALLGLPKSKKWVLSGPYADKSLIRNALIYSLYREMGNYAPNTKFIDLIINNNYRGIYVLTEKIQLSPEHLNITPLQINEDANFKASGGYLLEIDRNPWRGVYPPPSDTSAIPLSYALQSPKIKKLNTTVEDLIKSQVNSFEKHIYENDDLYNSLDINSFVDYLILTEFSKNIDGYCLSTFIYNKDITATRPKFYIGPIWDYNFSLGLTDYREGFNPEGYVYNSTKYIPFWWNKLLKDEQFKLELEKRYTQLRKTILSTKNVNKKIDALVDQLGNSTATNFEKWPVLNSKDFWPNYFLGKTYKEEIDYLKGWINKRLIFLDKDILRKEEKNQQYYETTIRNDSEWMIKIEKKAKERAISIEEMIRIDAKYMAEKKY
jgi:hypothetical protein